jgi:phenylacetate-coenzyme A ligase PaaK-like adenylate-forming protein
MAHQRDRLRHVLAHAVERSPFHARRLAGVEPGTFELDDLRWLPIMTRADMMAAFDDVVTDRRLTLEAVEVHLGSTGVDPTLVDGLHFAITSGGTSGPRKGVFVYAFDAMVEFISRVMVQGGPPRPGPTVVAALSAPTAQHASGLIAALAATPHRRIVRVPVTLKLDEIVKRLDAQQPDVLWGFPNVLRRLANEQTAGRLAIRPERILVGSEQLDPITAGEISAAFGAPVLNTFAASEGLVGACRPGEDAFTFATDLTIVELVDECDRPVPPGTPSARVLVTNLFNTVQPLIRYAMSDRLTRRPAAPGPGHLRATVDGRKEGFIYGDTYVDSWVVLEPLKRARAIVGWRIRQTPDGIDADVLVNGTVDRSALAAELLRALAEAGLPDPRVSLDAVDHLAPDPHTGKTRSWLPLAPQPSGAPE